MRGRGLHRGLHAELGETYLSRFLPGFCPEQNCQVCCFADLDCDGNVGVKDLLILLGAWGPCLGCPADLNCDGVVGVKDLLALLAAWGPCQANPPTEIPKTVQECYDKFYPQDMEALIACIEAVEAVSDP